MSRSDSILFSEPKKGGRKIQHERNLQIQCVTWFRYRFPKVKIIHIRNGGSLKGSVNPAFEGMRFKQMGVTPGVPDLFVPEWFLWVELKYRSLRVEREQKDFMDYLKSHEYDCRVTNSFEEFQSICNEKDAYFSKI